MQERTEEIKAAAQAAWKRDVKARLAALPAAELDALRRVFAAEVSVGRHGELFAADFCLRQWKATGAEGLFRIFAAGRLGVDSAGDYCRAEALKTEAG